MKYEVKSSILGFENTPRVEFTPVGDMLATIRDVDNENISFTLVSPYVLREYSFDIPISIQSLLEINENSNLLVYNTVMVVYDPIDDSVVNFLAPLIFNEDNTSIEHAGLRHDK